MFVFIKLMLVLIGSSLKLLFPHCDEEYNERQTVLVAA
jgi:hypothetical protein